MQHTPKVNGIFETCLYTRDLATTGRFYREIIGLEVVLEDAERYVFFRCGNGMLLVFDLDSARGGESDPPPHGAAGPIHMAFSVPPDALEAWREYLTANGVAIERTIDWPHGVRSIYIRDPAGNSIEFTTPALWPTVRG